MKVKIGIDCNCAAFDEENGSEVARPHRGRGMMVQKGMDCRCLFDDWRKQ